MSDDPGLPHLRAELMAMAAEDLRVRRELEKLGNLEGGYHWAMEIVHRANAARLRQIIAEHGWPGKSLVSEDGAEAAWLIAQHSVGEPEFQRACVLLLEAAIAAGEIPGWQLAYLIDRIAFFEGRPQLYGTQSDYDDDGYMATWPCEDSAKLNELRAAVGLAPLRERTSPPPEQTAITPERLRQHRSDFAEWARRMGWRK